MSENDGGGTAAVRAAAVHVSPRLAPGNGVPLLRHLALLAEVDLGPAPRAWTEPQARLLSAALVARARTDALGEGIALIQRYFDEARLTRPAALPASARAELLTSAAEYLNAIGRPQVAVRYAAEALLFADSPSDRYRALAAHAEALAVNGEFGEAREIVAEARGLFHGEGWDASEISHGLLFAESLIAVSQADPAPLLSIAEELERARPDDPYWRFSAGVMRVVGRWLQGDIAIALAKARQFLHGSGRTRSYRLMRERLVSMTSGLLTVQGEYGEALAMIADRVSHPGHAICFESQRATVLLQLGRDQELIDSTDACVAMDDHCLSPLSALLSRRAVALLRLGQEKRAAASMASALTLIERTGGSKISFLLILSGEAESLLDLVEAERPALRVMVDSARAALPLPTAPSQKERRIDLTAAERELARMLLSDLSLTQISQRRGVSVNTVKSQVRSIYGKLGVSSRADALLALRSPSS